MVGFPHMHSQVDSEILCPQCYGVTGDTAIRDRALHGRLSKAQELLWALRLSRMTCYRMTRSKESLVQGLLHCMP